MYQTLIRICLCVLALPIAVSARVYSFDFSKPTQKFRLSNIASIKDGVLLADSSGTSQRWNNYMISDPKSLPLQGDKVYAIEFDYHIIKSAKFPHDHGYFYFFIRTPKGTKFDIWKRWEGKDATKGHRRYVIKLPNQSSWRIYFGIKGQGVIELDNLKISEFTDMKSAEANTPPLYVHIGFEKDEPVRWSILHDFAKAKVVSSPNGNYLLADTTFDKIHTWRRYLQLAPSQIGIKKNTCYSVEFDYKILKSPSYFQLLERGSHGWRLLLSWSGAAGHKGKAHVIFVSDKNRACPLIFGMKGPGTIIIDNIVIREWKNKQQAKEGLKAANISRKMLRQQIKTFRTALSKIQKMKSSGLFSATQTKVNSVENQLKHSKFTIDDKLKLYYMTRSISRDIFKLKVMDYTNTSASAYTTFIDNSLVKIRKDADYEYKNKPTNSAKLSIAGNEYESFQIVIIPFRTISGLTLEFSNLKSADGKGVIKKENIKWYKVEYVNTQRELYPVKYVGWWPDPLVPTEKINIPSSQYAQPIWITVYVPAKTHSGKYNGTITIKAPNLPDRNISLTVNVRTFSLPKKATFKTSFAARDAAGYYVKWGILKKGDPALKNMDRLYRDALLEHKLSPARIASVKPKLMRNANGDYYVDFSQFDKDLNHYLARGLNSFTFGGYWGWRNTMKGAKQKFIVWPENADKPEQIVLNVLSEPYKKLMLDYFRSWAEYLQRKGCLDDVYCYIYDEPGTKEIDKVNKLLNVLHQANHRLKAIIPGVPNGTIPKTFSLDLDILCPLLPGITDKRMHKLQAKGRHLWCYVCLNPRHPYPNFFVDYPATDHRIIFWMAWKYKVEGLLYWQTTFWANHNPWDNIETYTTTHGDGCLFYPSLTKPIKVIPAMRLENIRDGVEDYEYFVTLKKLVNHIENAKIKVDSNLLKHAQELLAIPNSIVATPSSYTNSPTSILSYRDRVGNIIDKLNSAMAK